MASARNLCQHSDYDGIQCTSNDYIYCPHCQLQLCLKHLNLHQDLLRTDFYNLCNHINFVRYELDHLIFDSNNQRQILFNRLDQWYNERLNSLNQLYNEKKQQLNILYIQSQIEFDTYKTKKDKQLKEYLLRKLKKISKQEQQINIDDVNYVKYKLEDIEKGLDELKHLLIDMNYDQTTMDIHIVKKRYVEAAKSSFIDEDEENLSDTDDDEDSNNLSKESPPVDVILLSPSDDTSPKPTTTTTPSAKKPPLKFIIKRLNQPSRTSTKVKYRFHSVSTSAPLIT